MIKIIVASWFMVCTTLIFSLSNSAKSEFDPDMKLSQAIMSMEFETELSNKLTTLLSTKPVPSHEQFDSPAQLNYPKGFLINIVQGDCYCEWLSNRHQNNLKSWAKDTNFVSVMVNLDDFPFLTEYIPSTPSIIALDADHQLIYLGPYSRGMGCYGASGEVDKILKRFIAHQQSELSKDKITTIPSMTSQARASQTKNDITGIIETDAKGCYCAT